MKHSQYLHPDLMSQDNLALVANHTKGPLYKHQQPNPVFDKESLMKIPDHKWMEKVDMVLVTQEKYPDLIEDFLPELLRNASIKVPAHVMPPMPEEELPTLMGLDLETTGLHKTILLHGGKPTLPEKLVGICVAPSDTLGYYIPVFHNELDGVKNYPYEMAVNFLRALQDPSLLMIYHNAQYDREQLEVNNVSLNPEFIDSMLLLDNMDYKKRYFQVGLKVMAEKLLKRKMLEIKDLSGVNTFIPLQYYPARTLTAYGCSDAANTFGLFMHALNHERDPYKVNKFPMRLDMRTNDYTRWMLRAGMPLDYEWLGKALRTSIRRKLILQATFKREITDKIEIGSPEQVGIFLGNMIFDRFKAAMEEKELPEEEVFGLWQKKAHQLFECEVKKKTLKSGVQKITYSSGDDILSSYKKIKDKNVPWIPDNEKEILIKASSMIGTYRSLVHDIGVFSTMYRFAYVDDTNYHRVAVGLKFNGTVTNRYSNQGGKGSLDRFTIRRLVRSTKLEFRKADAVCGLNLQGVNSSPMITNKRTKKPFAAMKVVQAPEEFLAEKKRLDEEVESILREHLEQM